MLVGTFRITVVGNRAITNGNGKVFTAIPPLRLTSLAHGLGTDMAGKLSSLHWSP